MADSSTSAGHTPGPWKARAMGGHSVVIVPTKPPINDTRVPAYGYREEEGWSIGYPFLEDRPADVRPDFVCFGHANARLIAAAPDLLSLVKDIEESLTADGTYRLLREACRAAIAKATGASS